MPEGASHEGKDEDGNDIFRVSIPLDESGHFGRQCPSCSQVFRIRHEDYDALPDDLQLWCVYCGHVDDHSVFLTDQQRERLTRVVSDYGTQMINGMLSESFGDLARGSRSNDFVKITYRSEPFYPQPLPGINEEQLVRERECSTCGVHYAVFGDHRFCPISGPLAPSVIATDAFSAEASKLDALSAVASEAVAVLKEQGVFDRIYADTVKSVVTVVETFAERTFRDAVSGAEKHLKGKGNVFQRLDDTADLFLKHRNFDLRNVDGVNWPILIELWAARHVYTHNDGLVDDRYLAAVPTSALIVGQRLRLTESDARLAIEQAGRLCDAIGRS